MTHKLDAGTASRFAAAALGHVTREYPNKMDHVLSGPEDIQGPRALHPIFFGSFDWHSCVHGWWTMFTLLRLYPDIPEAARIRTLADAMFTPENVAAETAYLNRPGSRGFERPYGWAWLLMLAAELERHPGKHAGILQPLILAFARRFADYLPLADYPVRVGTHFNTAFALLRTLDATRPFRHADAVVSGELVDELGGLDAAIAYAVAQAKLGPNYRLVEYPHPKELFEVVHELIEKIAPHNVRAPGLAVKLAEQIEREVSVLRTFNDPQGVYARLPLNLSLR
jgi:hypothetical protein